MSVSIQSVWESFNTPLEKFVRRRLPDEQAAEDILQELYLKLYQHVGEVRHDDRLRAWVYQVARNTIADYYREQKPVVRICDEIAIPSFDSYDHFTLELATSVRRIIERLPETYGQALLLTDYEGLSQRELAERMGISLSGAKSRVQRGRRLLQETLAQRCHFEFDRRGRIVDYHPRWACRSLGCKSAG
jgi:RNA polymerase sigma-70 factor (ECF subfamily)